MKREDALHALDRVQEDLGALEARKGERAREHTSFVWRLVYATGALFLSMGLFVGVQGLVPKALEMAAFALAMMTLLGCILYVFLGGVWHAGKAALTGAKDGVERISLARERQQIVDQHEVRGGLQVHQDTGPRGGLSVHEDTTGGLSESR